MSKAKDLAGMVWERYTKSARARQHVIDEMDQARMFYRGDQWLAKQGGRWVNAPQPKWRVRMTVNKLPMLVDLSISTFLRHKPIIIGSPSTDEEEDRYSAKIAEILLRYHWDDLQFDERLIDCLQWVFVCGSCFGRVTWDPEHGKERPVPVYDEMGEEVGVEMQKTGRTDVDFLSPFSVEVEPGADSIDDAGYLIVTEMLRKDVAEERFNRKIEGNKAMDGSLMHPVLIERDGRTPDARERVTLLEMYERPTKKHANGRLVYVANNEVVHQEPLPEGEIRMVHFKGIDLPGELWPTSTCSQVLPMQMEINRGRSQMIENRNLCSRPQLISPIGAVDEGEWNNRPGQNIEWDTVAARNIEPHYLAPPQIPGWVLNIMSMAESDMMDLSSRHDATQGSPSGSSSGRMAAMMRAADDSRLAPQIRRFEQSLKKLGIFMLKTDQENMTGEQVVSILGKNRQAEIHKFQAQDISSNVNVRFEIASQLPWARESMRQQIIYLAESGKIDNDTMFEMLEMPTIQRQYEHEQEHLLNARREDQMLQQAYFAPLATDNHNVHLRCHESYVNQPERREQMMQEVMEMRQMAMMQAQMEGRQLTPEEEQQLAVPPSVKNHLQHMETHRSMMPTPQAPAPAMKVNVSGRDVAHTPEGQQLILQSMKEALGEPETPSNPQPGSSAGARAPGQTPVGIATPPGGGGMGETLNPTAGEVYGGGKGP